MKIREYWRKSARRTGNLDAWMKYRSLKRKVKREIRQTERESIADQVKRSCIPKKSSSQRSFSGYDKTVADEFNRFFTSVGHADKINSLVLSIPLKHLKANQINWCFDNRLLLNPDKTELMLQGSCRILSNLHDVRLFSLGNDLIPAKAIKDLSITFDPNLTFYDHILKTVFYSNCIVIVSYIFQFETTNTEKPPWEELVDFLSYKLRFYTRISALQKGVTKQGKKYFFTCV